MNLVFYHDRCADGEACKFIAELKFKPENVECIPYSFQSIPSRDWNQYQYIYCLDCVVPDLPKDKTIIIDHHVGNLPVLATYPNHYYDENKCGAVLSWEHFFPNTPVPDFIRYVDDRDRWQWKLENSKEVNAALRSFPNIFEVYLGIMNTPIRELANQGIAILRSQQQEIEHILLTASMITVGKYQFLAVNSQTHMSELGHELAKKSDPGLVYYYVGNMMKCSLRSINVDVCAIAKEFGGGGHKHAAGFSLIHRDNG